MKITALFVAAIVSCAAVSRAAEEADAPNPSELVKPASWAAFVDYYKQGGDFGTWKSTGKTVKIWEGIPGGLDYTLTVSISGAHGGKAILESHYMATSTGEVISTGAKLLYWDGKSKTVLQSHSGFDQGQLYTGHSELLGIDSKKQVIKWKYTETSRGKTAAYYHTIKRTAANKRWQSHQLASGGQAWSEELTRETAAAAARAPGRRTLQRLRGLLRRLR
ncbi:MAG: hypothetical protein VX346_17065 [Planctomycetota bacterium]|nr:hypothetical protein [Planctomycetota bacterium]